MEQIENKLKKIKTNNKKKTKNNSKSYPKMSMEYTLIVDRQ